MQPDCTMCPLNGRVKVPPEGNLAAEIVLIGEAPGKEEVEQIRPFVGKSGKVLNALLERVGLHREDVFLTNSALCLPEPMQVSELQRCPSCKGRKARKGTPAVDCGTCHNTGSLEVIVDWTDKQVLKEAAKHCRSRLLGELNIIKPKVAVPLGNFALDALVGKTKGILAHRGAVHEVELKESE